MEMKMKMKDNKMLLALTLVAALALCSVAAVAVSEDVDAKILVNGTDTTIDSEGYDKDISIAGDGTLIIIGEYSGTITVYAGLGPDSNGKERSEVLSTFVCSGISNVTFKAGETANGGTSTPATAVQLYGSTTGSIELTKGTVTLGTAAETPFTGSIKVLDGTVDSENTYGAVVTLNAASGQVGSYVAISGTVASGEIFTSNAGTFTGTFTGITNVMLGNDLTISAYKASANANASAIGLSGTLNKLTLDASSAVGTIFKQNMGDNQTFSDAEYGFVYNGAMYYVLVDSKDKITGIYNNSGNLQTIFNYSDLKVGSGNTEGKVSGLTGTLYLNVDTKVSASTTLGVSATIVNNKDLTFANGAKLTIAAGTDFINNGNANVGTDITVTANSTGKITNYGTIVSKTISGNSYVVPYYSALINGFYLEKTVDNVTALYVYGTLDAALESAGTSGTVTACGNNFINGDVTINKDQTVTTMNGTGVNAIFAIDGTSKVIVYGTFNNGCTVVSSSHPGKIVIASGAVMDVTGAIGLTNAGSTVDVDGTLVIKKTDVTESQDATGKTTSLGTVTADTLAKTSTIYTYTNLYNALTNTSTGTVKLLCNATLQKSASVKDDVTLISNGQKLTIAEDVTLTADGHFQMKNGLNLIGTLIINDTTAPVITAGSESGSFMTADIYLYGTIQVSAGAVLLTTENIKYGTGATVVSGLPTNFEENATGSIIVDGTYYLGDPKRTGTTHASIWDLKTLVVSSTGVMYNTNTVYYVDDATIAGELKNDFIQTSGSGKWVQSYFNAKNLSVSGTFTNAVDAKYAGILFVETFDLTGTLVAGNATEIITTSNDKPTVATIDGVFVGKVMTIAEDAEITGKVSLFKIVFSDYSASGLTHSYAIAYGAFDVKSIFGATPLKTTFYIGDDVYATEYATGNTMPIVLPTPEIVGFSFVSWYSDSALTSVVTVNAPGIIGNSTNGKYVALYGKLTVEKITVTVTPVTGANILVDGAPIQGPVSLDYNAKGYVLSILAEKGYDISNAKILVNEKELTGNYVPQAGDKITVTGVTEKVVEEDSGMGITEILLIVITIMVVVMAIIIALKLMRS